MATKCSPDRYGGYYLHGKLCIINSSKINQDPLLKKIGISYYRHEYDFRLHTSGGQGVIILRCPVISVVHNLKRPLKWYSINHM